MFIYWNIYIIIHKANACWSNGRGRDWLNATSSYGAAGPGEVPDEDSQRGSSQHICHKRNLSWILQIYLVYLWLQMDSLFKSPFSLQSSLFFQRGPTVSDLTWEATLVTRPPFWSLPPLNNANVSIPFTSPPRRFKRHLISYLFTALSRDLKFKIACIFNSKLSQGRSRRKRIMFTLPHFDKHDLPSPGRRDYAEQKLARSPVPGLKAIGATD